MFLLRRFPKATCKVEPKTLTVREEGLEFCLFLTRYGARFYKEIERLRHRGLCERDTTLKDSTRHHGNPKARVVEEEVGLPTNLCGKNMIRKCKFQNRKNAPISV